MSGAGKAADLELIKETVKQVLLSFSESDSMFTTHFCTLLMLPTASAFTLAVSYNNFLTKWQRLTRHTSTMMIIVYFKIFQASALRRP